MDYDDGLPLSEFLRRREAAGQPFTEADLRAVVEPLLEGLEVVHRAGVLHRDIKPANIFVRRPDDITGRPAQPVLIDFGAAKQNYLARHSRSQAPYTPGYAAYEQVSSMGELGPWTDVYALGALMWRMVAGGCLGDERLQEPRSVDNAGGLGVGNPTPPAAERRAYALHRGQPDPMAMASALGAGRFSPTLLASIDRCLVLYPEDRVQSVAELRSLLDDTGAGTGAGASAEFEAAPTSQAPSPVTSSRSRAGAVAASLAVMVSLSFIGGYLWLRTSADQRSLPDATEDSSTGTLPSSVAGESAPPSVVGGSAILVVQTDPPGAEVVVGNTVVGETPLRLGNLRSGTYPVTLRHPAYEPFRLENQTFEDGVVLRIERTLVRGTGRLTVIARPVTAWIEHEGARLAEGTPVTLEGLPAGILELTLGANEHRTILVRAEVPKDGVGMLESELEPIPYGTLTLELEPPDATVTLPDVRISYRPGVRLPEGSHRIVVSRVGYREIERTVTVLGESRVRIQLAVDPQPFTVAVTPTEAAVSFVEYAEAYEPAMLLEPGTYRVRVSTTGYEPWEGSIEHGVEPTQASIRLSIAIPAVGGTFSEPFNSGGEGPEMVVIPAGRFRMGCLNDDGDCDGSEFPVHEVVIPRAFAVSKYEVTFEQWDACAAGGGCGGNRPDDAGWGRGRSPAINVSWDDAREFVEWLSRQTDQSYRLLSEAEWEYVARAGSETTYSWGNAVGSNRANCSYIWEAIDLSACGDLWEYTAPVGSFVANSFGVHNMHGNVSEWVEDCWNAGYPGAPSDGSAWRSGDCSLRVLRGGSWFDSPENLRSANRRRNSTGSRSSIIGFRVARTLIAPGISPGGDDMN